MPKLRQIEVLTAQGRYSAPACEEAKISERSYCRWRRAYGGLRVQPAGRTMDLERENARLQRRGADAMGLHGIPEHIAETTVLR